jgi:hypothetical protein
MLPEIMAETIALVGRLETLNPDRRRKGLSQVGTEADWVVWNYTTEETYRSSVADALLRLRANFRGSVFSGHGAQAALEGLFPAHRGAQFHQVKR